VPVWPGAGNYLKADDDANIEEGVGAPRCILGEGDWVSHRICASLAARRRKRRLCSHDEYSHLQAKSCCAVVATACSTFRLWLTVWSGACLSCRVNRPCTARSITSGDVDGSLLLSESRSACTTLHQLMIYWPNIRMLACIVGWPMPTGYGRLHSEISDIISSVRNCPSCSRAGALKPEGKVCSSICRIG